MIASACIYATAARAIVAGTALPMIRNNTVTRSLSPRRQST
jgi:hypothetical protein